jgi:flagellar FliJ protein
MSGFKFSLQQVLQIREQSEKTAAARLAEAEAAADEARVAQRALETIQERGSRELHKAHSSEPTIGQLKTLGYVIDQLNFHIADAQTRVDSAEQTVTAKRTDLTSALQARRVLTRLRERHFTTWRTADNAEQMKEMDELALSRFVRRDDNDTSGAAGE